MSGFPLILAFVAAIVLMILAISKWKIHPFLSIMGISLVLGLVAGVPLVNRTAADGAVTPGLANVIGAGFSGTFTSIGIVIILGALIGTILEATGAALKLADMVIHVVGKKRPELAVLLMGWVVSIPVFCDSGFVILNPIRKALVKRTMTSSVTMTVALSAGLYISHVFIPPTPGPIAAASTLGIGDNLLLVMGMGALCSIIPLFVGYFFAKYIGKKVKAGDEACDGETARTYEELVAEFGKLPGGAAALAPIVVPILLMALGSIAAMAGWTGFAYDLCAFLGAPIIALAVGTLFGVVLLAGAKRLNKFYEFTNETLKTVGPILFVTAAGGVLGKVIAVSGMVETITANASILEAVGIFFRSCFQIRTRLFLFLIDIREILAKNIVGQFRPHGLNRFFRQVTILFFRGIHNHVHMWMMSLIMECRVPPQIFTINFHMFGKHGSLRTKQCHPLVSMVIPQAGSIFSAKRYHMGPDDPLMLCYLLLYLTQNNRLPGIRKKSMLPDTLYTRAVCNIVHIICLFRNQIHMFFHHSADQLRCIAHGRMH